MEKLRLLDLFCGAGGCSVGYHQAGFEVEGVDNKPQKNYLFKFHLANALTFPLDGFDVVHASPPCQLFSSFKYLANLSKKVNLIWKTRNRLRDNGLNQYYIIENVKGAPLHNPTMLCGTMFGLKLSRHRYFETNFELPFLLPPCNHSKICKSGREKRGKFVNPCGHFSETEYCKKVMGIDWMTQKELSQAIPPVYTKWIGEQILRVHEISR